MSESKIEQIQHAIADLNAIRSVIERVEEKKGSDSSRFSVEIYRMLYGALIVLSIVVLALEHFHVIRFTAALYASHYSWSLRYTIIGVIAFVLCGIVVLCYGCSLQLSRKKGESFKDYNKRHAHSTSSIAFLSDLLLKFIVIAVIVLSGRGDWVAAMLAIFTGDYLLQGRLFLIPFSLALPFGIFCITFGTVQLLFYTGWILYPFLLFISANIASLYFSKKMHHEAYDGESA